ncbi:MAG: DUF4783 domain-containing protein [Chitinophagales bacterium]
MISNLSIGQEIHVQLETALVTANVKTFSKLFDKRIEIVIDGDAQDYSQQQAQVVLNKFLSNFSEISFELMHSGVSKNQSKYYIGKMKTSNAIYQVYVYFKRINNADYVQEIKFEKQTN